MSSRLQQLEDSVRAMYEAKDPNRADWADFLFEDHVLIVADYATDLAQKYEANAEFARAAALLHDIADAVMPRHDQAHGERSLEIARELLGKFGYLNDEIDLIVDDAIRYHSCHDGEQPTSIEGKILSTADSMAHLKTDFYLYSIRAFTHSKSFAENKDWVLKKLDRDLSNKVFFDDERENLRRDYDMLKEIFSR